MLIKLALLEVHVVHHCNLNCAGCAHYAPLADGDWELSVNDLRLGLTALRVAGLEPSTIRLFGGEPTLHSALGDLLVLTREMLPSVEILLMTNGLRRREWWFSLTQILLENCVKVEITGYPNVPADATVNFLQAVGVRAEVYSVDKHLRHHAITADHRHVAADEQCVMRAGTDVSTQLVCAPVPTLWSCPVVAYSWIARRVFSDFPVPGDDCRVVLDHRVTEEELARLAQPTSFCAHCVVGQEHLPWTVSTRSRREW